MWLNRDPIGELGFELIRRRDVAVSAGEPNLYRFVANSPPNLVDYLGLKDWNKTIETAEAAAEEAVKTACPGGEFAAALKVFKACSALGVALAWAKTQRDNCIGDAYAGDPKDEAAREAACAKKWDKKINLLQDTYNAKCKGKD